MVIVMISIILGVLSLLFFTLWLWGRRTLYWISWKCEGPLTLPFIGSAWELRHTDDNLRIIDEYCNKYKSPVRFWLSTSLFIVIHDLDDVETLLRSPECLTRLPMYRFMRDVISTNAEGLFTLDGTDWKLHRKIVAKMFNHQTMVNSIPSVNKHIRTFISDLDNQVGKSAFDIRTNISQTTMDLFMDSILGTELRIDDKKKHLHYLTNGQVIIAKRFFIPPLQNGFVWNLTGYSKLIKKYGAFSMKWVDKIIESKKLIKSCGGKTILDHLLEASKENQNFSIDDAKAEVITLLIGGTDTIGISFAFAILCLAMYPNYQDKCYEELKEILPTKDSEFTSELLSQMPYTEMCIKESMRLFPVVPIIGRSPTIPLKLKNITIPPNQKIVIPIRTIMRKNEYYGEDSDQFNPDHFLPNTMPPSSFLPFSLGVRNCLADKYVLVMIRVFVAQCLRNYRFTSPLKLKELKVRGNISSELLNKHMVTLERRPD